MIWGSDAWYVFWTSDENQSLASIEENNNNSCPFEISVFVRLYLIAAFYKNMSLRFYQYLRSAWA